MIVQHAWMTISAYGGRVFVGLPLKALLSKIGTGLSWVNLAPVILICIISFLGVLIYLECLVGDCEFYNEIERIIPCDGTPNAYATEYGYRYCNRFAQFSNDFTSKVSNINTILSKIILILASLIDRVKCGSMVFALVYRRQ